MSMGIGPPGSSPGMPDKKQNEGRRKNGIGIEGVCVDSSNRIWRSGCPRGGRNRPFSVDDLL